MNYQIPGCFVIKMKVGKRESTFPNANEASSIFPPGKAAWLHYMHPWEPEYAYHRAL
jgi:NADH:ubiquinone oxidoreductase subunit